MGAAIECFDGAAAVEVPRSRFSPVKTTSDLLAVRSDAYELDKSFRVGLRAERQGVPPKVDLSDDYKLVDKLEELVAAGVPSLIRSRSLSIKGPWRFVADVEIVGEAGNGREAVAAIKRSAPDLVFLDIQMPEMGGYEVARSLRRGPAGDGRPPRIIGLSGEGQEPETYAAAGMDAFLVKPVRLAHLVQTLEHHAPP